MTLPFHIIELLKKESGSELRVAVRLRGAIARH